MPAEVPGCASAARGPSRSDSASGARTTPGPRAGRRALCDEFADEPGREYVQRTAQHVRGAGPQALHQYLDSGPHHLAPGGRRFRDPAGGAGGQPMQMFVFLGLQTQRAGKGTDHARAGTGLLASLPAEVLVDADPGERREFLSTQSRGATQTQPGGQADPLRGQLCAPGAQAPREAVTAWFSAHRKRGHTGSPYSPPTTRRPRRCAKTLVAAAKMRTRAAIISAWRYPLWSTGVTRSGPAIWPRL